eukprot:5921127-Ditylum_brightwellii.AAC.1
MVPSIFIWTISFISACMKTPGISTVAMSLPSFASIRHDIIRDSLVTVGALASSLGYSCAAFFRLHIPVPLFYHISSL